MSQSSTFTPVKPETRYEHNKMFDTDMTTGQIVEFLRETSITTNPDGTVVYGPAQDFDPQHVNEYTVVGTAAEAPQLVRIASEALAVAADAAAGVGVALAAIPAYADYAEIYVEDENIRWVQDGSIPADNNGEQEMAGTTIKLFGRQAIEGFKAVVIDNTGAVTSDAAAISNLSVSYWNQNPENAPVPTSN